MLVYELAPKAVRYFVIVVKRRPAFSYFCQSYVAKYWVDDKM